MATAAKSEHACLRCHEVKPKEAFDLGPSGWRRRGVCRACIEADGERPGYREQHAPRVEATYRRNGVLYRRCSRCGREARLTAANYYVTRPRVEGVQRFDYRCKPCAREVGREKYRRQKESGERLARKREVGREAQRRYEQRHPDRVRAARKRYVARLKRQPTRWAERLDNRRIQAALRREAETGTARRQAPRADTPRTVLTERGGMLPSGPLVALVESRARGVVALTEACEALAIDERQYRSWKAGQRVQLDVAERVIHAANLLWFDVYDEARWPEAHAEAAALIGGEVAA
jgi:hypothetical protein